MGTTLVAAEQLGRSAGETWLAWDRPPAAFTGDYLLTFRKPSMPSA